MDTADVIVIGGGSTGTSIAWHLGAMGARTVLLEKAGVAAGATGKSSAIVRTHYILEPLARMAVHSLRVFQHFGEVVGATNGSQVGDAGFHSVGFLVPLPAEDRAAAAANVAMNRAVGIDSHLLRPEEGKEIEPRMAWDDVGVAVWEPESGYADGYLTANAYAQAARREGVEIRIGTHVRALWVEGGTVRGVRTAQGDIEAPAVVVAAGFRTRDLLMPLGIDLPLTAVRHDIAILRRSSDFGPPHPVVSDRIRGRYHLPHVGDVTMIGTNGPGGIEDSEVEADRGVPPDHLEFLVEGFLQRFPSEEDAVLQGGYTGPYDCSPDLQPALGALPQVEGLFVAAGFSGHGFKLSPAVGRMMAETVLQGASTLVDISYFDPNRFSQGRLITAEHPYSLRSLG